VSSLVPFGARQSYIDLNFDGILNDPLNPALSSLIYPSGVIPDKSRSFSETQPKVAFRWDASDNTSIFGSYGVGFKAGGFNNSGSAATVDIFINGFINGGMASILPTSLAPPCRTSTTISKKKPPMHSSWASTAS
jgi:iron complex outermembrane receptor protein